MNIASFFARFYIDALSVALAPFPANARPANARPANDVAAPVARTAPRAGNDDLPRAA